jgi:hypothetical protein
MYGPGGPLTQTSSYACRTSGNLGKTDPRRCTGNAISARQLENMAEMMVTAIAANPRWQSALQAAYAARSTCDAAVQEDVEEQLAELDRRLTDLRLEKQKAKSSRRLAQVERDIDELDTRMSELESSRPRQADLGRPELRVDFDQRWQDLDRPARRQVLGDLLKSIAVAPSTQSGAGQRSRTFDPSRVQLEIKNAGVLHLTEPLDLTPLAANCPECGKSYGDQLALGAHRRHKHGVPGATSKQRVTALSRYGCTYEGCDKQSSSPGGMKRHITVMHGPHESLECPHGCPKLFRGILELNSHVRQRHTAPPVGGPEVCQDCGKACQGVHGLSVHRGKAHPGQP